MANTITSILPLILARALPVLRENAVTPRTVNTSYSLTPQTKGKTIDVPYGASKTAAAVTPAVTAPTPSDTTMSTVQVVLDTWEYADFHLTDQELTQIDADASFIPVEAAEAMKALGNSMDNDLLGLYTNVYSGAGTAGSTPFDTDANLATQWNGGAAKLLDDQLAGRDDRHVILNAAAYGNMSGRQPVQSAAWRGAAPGEAAGRSGEIGFWGGANWHINQNVLSHTAGTPGGTPLVNGAHTAGDTTIAVDGMTATTGDYHAGDIVTFASHSQQYVVDSLMTADGTGAGTMTISGPNRTGLAAALADNDAVTLVASHAVNLAYHRNAFAFATAPLADLTLEGVEQQNVFQMPDPVTGVVVRVQAIRQWMQWAFVFDALWGVKTVVPDLATRIFGE